jgi:hypothetical protein
VDIPGMSGTTIPPISAEQWGALPPEFRALLRQAIDDPVPLRHQA